jgi:group I intron endonuclease
MQIYLITNDVNDRAYVGACMMPLERRWAGHKSWARKGRGYALHAAMREIGIDKFHVVRVFSGYISREKMKRLEEYYIKCFKTMVPNGYNETIGGTTRIFKPCSDEKRRKISEALKGHPVSQETREKIRNSPCGKAAIGRPVSEAVRAKHRARMLGRTVSPETRQKISDTLKGNIPWNKGRRG